MVAMDLRQLAALTAVADCGTFSAAADKLHTVQSNVSAHIARLERLLGATLVDRSAGRLTEEGAVVVDRARRIQHELEALVADVTALRSEVTGDVRIGIIGSVARWLVASLYLHLKAAHPGVNMIVVDASTTSLAPQLVGGGLSLAIVNLPIVDEDVVVQPLFQEDMVAVVPPGHPYSGREDLGLEDFDGSPLLLPPAGTAYRTELDAAAARIGIELVPLAEIDGVRLITSLAFDGLGMAIVPASAVPRQLRQAYRPVTVRGLPRRRVGVVQRRKGLLPAPARALLSVLDAALREEAQSQPGIFLDSARLVDDPLGTDELAGDPAAR